MVPIQAITMITVKARGPVAEEVVGDHQVHVHLPQDKYLHRIIEDWFLQDYDLDPIIEDDHNQVQVHLPPHIRSLSDSVNLIVRLLSSLVNLIVRSLSD